MATRIPEATRNAAADAVVDLLDGGVSFGYVEIREGTQPADPDSAATGTLLATIPLNDPAFGAAAAGVATMDNTPAPTVAAAATGTAGWFRAYDDNDVPVIDGSAGTSGTDMILNTASLVSGIDVSITAWTVTMPDGT